MPSPRDVGVVIVAAGSGTRIGGDTPKQFLEIAGVPMLLRSIRPFARHPSVAHVVVVLRAHDAAAPPAWLLSLTGDTLSVVAGGSERSDSVAAGIAALPANCTVILVHDAARPFIDTGLIDRVIDAVRAGHAVVPALAVSDTIKEMDSADTTRIARTLPREQLRSVQTPQGFPRRMLEEAHAGARRDGRKGTDDAALVEQAGGMVRIVAGDPHNVKVTTTEDLELAEYLGAAGHMILPFRDEPDARAAAPIVKQHLAAGRLLAYPTETVYGLGSAPETEALASLARLKGRPPRKPFLLLVSSRLMAEAYGLDFNASARAMADACWPGPLTLVLPGGEGRLPPELRGVEGGIAVRHTSQGGVALMISLMGHALTSTSANRPGQPTAPGTDGIVATFGEAEASGELLVLDGGVLGNVPPSTLVDCTAALPRIIRDGAIPRAELRRMAGRLAP